MYDTEPASAIDPPLRVIAVRTSPSGPVAVVGEALDQESDTARGVALVHDRLVVGAATLEPEPRLTARSMLSLGTDDFFAFWIASYKVGLPVVSPPPCVQPPRCS
jgi:hypothetical protein